MYVRSMSGTVVQEMIAAMRAAHDALAACDIDSLTLPELLAAGRRVADPDLSAAHPEPPHPGPAAGRGHTQGDGRQVVEGRAGDPVADLDR